MKRKPGKILAMLLAASMLLATTPLAALAQEEASAVPQPVEQELEATEPEEPEEPEAEAELPDANEVTADGEADTAEEEGEEQEEGTAQVQALTSGTFLEFFPDPEFAQGIARELRKNNSDIVTIEELEALMYLSIYDNKKVSNIEGISYLKNLRSIYLYNTNLTILPEEINELSNLEELGVYIGKLNSLPDLSNLSNLSSLNLAYNQIDEFPSTILELTCLTYIDLSGNPIGYIPQEIANLDLSNLKLAETSLSEFPNIILELSTLEYLAIGGNPFKDIPQEISQLENLRTLDLSRMNFDEFPTSIYGIPNLVSLVFEWNDGSILPDSFSELRVSQLDLNRNKLTEVPKCIFDMPNLSRLNLTLNEITELPSELFEIETLAILTANNNQVQYLPDNVINMKNKSLQLSWNALLALPDSFFDVDFSPGTSWMLGNQYAEYDLIISPDPAQWSLETFVPPIAIQLLDANENISAPHNYWEIEAPDKEYNVVPFIDGTEIFPYLSELGEYTILYHMAFDSPLYGFSGLYQINVTVGDLLPVDDTFLDYFPDAALAQAVAESVGKVNTDSTTAAELAGITTLDASSRGVASLEGIGNLTGLTSLNASYNNLTSAPTEIGALTGLTNLDLRSNQISSLPPEIGNLTSLAHLYLNVNALEALPQELDGIATLRTLYAQNNAITEALPEICYTLAGSRAYFQRQTATLPTVTVTDGTDITSDLLLPGFVRQLQAKNGGHLVGKWTISGPSGTQTVAAGNGSEITPALFAQEGVYTVVYSTDGGSYAINSLSISALEYTIQVTVGGSVQPGNTFADYFPDGILAQAVAETVGKNSTDDATPAELASITDLNVVGKGVQDLTGIGNLTGLLELRVSSNALGSLPAEIGNLQSLRVLGVASCNLTSLPAELWTLGSLQVLAVDGNPLGGLPQELGQLSSLTTLYANAIGMTEELPASVFSLSSSVLSDQTAALPALSLSLGAPVNSSQLLPPVVEQLAGLNGGNLVGEWAIIGPDGVSQIIPAGNGSEISSALFPTAGQYTVRYATGSSFYSAGTAAMGQLTYTTEVIVS